MLWTSIKQKKKGGELTFVVVINSNYQNRLQHLCNEGTEEFMSFYAHDNCKWITAATMVKVF